MRLRQVLISGLVCVVFIAGMCFAAGMMLSAPATHAIGKPPADFMVQPVVFRSAGNNSISGWFCQGIRGQGAILLLHGIRADRYSMLNRARLLHRSGFSVLLIDLPAHGASTGERISFGLREADGVRSALQFLRAKLPGEAIGVIGVSLGAASFVIAKASPQPDAVMLESMFPTIAEAVDDRIRQRVGGLSEVVTPLLLLQLPLQLGIQPKQLRPIEDIRSLHSPVLIASGTRDQDTTIAEARRIYKAANEPKEFWPVEGAAHVDLYRYAPNEYEKRVVSFFSARLLRSNLMPPGP